ncbi:MAG: helicase-related protein [candidate division WOR-3 bacterium]|nr:helicase-related protein [candidate division WOR-3 bacterium]MCX7947478.1 helicase-related protein [candidate division WOR-3 bacterium]MDW8150637.1 helicase-related protein [candidate division WOR-3 bacterium]
MRNIEKLAELLLEKYEELSNENESTIIFVYKKELGWEIIKKAYEKNYKIINKTLPFKLEYREKIENYDIGFHNADIPYEEKEEIENAFRNGTLKCLVATQTLAYGINLPADRVIILITSFYDREKKKYKTTPSITDIVQMEGRAGRFGIKEVGYVNKLLYRLSEGTYDKIYDQTFNNKQVELLENMANSNLLENYLGESAILSSFILSAYKISKGNILEFFNKTYTFKDFRDIKKLNDILGFLENKRYIINGKITDKADFCISTGIPPTAYEEFLRRSKVEGNIFVKVRPLIYTKKIRDCLKSFLGEQDLAKFYKMTSYLIPFGQPEDGSHELVFFTEGGLFKIPNIHNPPSELYFNNEIFHLCKALFKITHLVIPNEDVLRIAHGLRYGLDYKFSPLGSIEGIGHMRANAIKIALLLEKKTKSLNFENRVKDILDLISEKALAEALSIRFIYKENITRELNSIMNILKANSEKLLIDERILRGLSLFKLDKESALKLPIEELYQEYKES